MKIYTKTGDAGETGLVGASRIAKDDPRIEAVGTVDELNSLLGVVRSFKIPDPIQAFLAKVQNELFDVGAWVATPVEAKGKQKIKPVEDASCQDLEAEIDRLQNELPPLRQFILPDGSTAGAMTHLARSVCRRAERRVLTLAKAHDDPQLSVIVVYLNRLSDLLFVVARSINSATNKIETPWNANLR